MSLGDSASATVTRASAAIVLVSMGNRIIVNCFATSAGRGCNSPIAVS
jgi:hypothetical protein